MNHYVVLGIFGIIRGIAASLADLPLARPGKVKPGETLPLNGISPWWADVTDKRFIVSFWLSFLGAGFILLSVLLIIAGVRQNTVSLCLHEQNSLRR